MVSWKQKVGLGPIELVGLDIGSASVKLVQLLRDENGYVGTQIAVAPIEPGGNDKDETLDARTGRAVRQCFKQVSTSPHAVCGICGPEVMVRTFKFPNLPEEAIPQAVLMEAQQVCPLDISTSVVDYRLIQPNGHNTSSEGLGKGTSVKQGVLVVALNEAIQSQMHRARGGSAKVALMDVEGLALLNCVSTFEHREPHSSIAVVNVGKTNTNVAVLGSDGLPFIRDLPSAANEIIQSIAASVGGDTTAIEQAITDKEKAAALGIDMTTALREPCRGLVSSISETLRYYQLQEDSDPIRRVLLCGGFALVGEFVQMLDNALTEEVLVFNPFAEIPWVGDRAGLEWAQRVGPALAVATGLAMRTT